MTDDPQPRPGRETIRIPRPGESSPPPATPAGGPSSGGGDLTNELIATDQWTDDQVAAAGIPVHDVPLVSVGGGLGSFVMADLLRISGMPPSTMHVLGQAERPWDTYNYLASVSQVPERERLRSDAGSTADNIWGFPSYAVREAFAARSLTGFIAPLFQVLVEPFFTDYYTPKAGQVYRGLQREADRIGWWDMVTRGQVRMTRRRIGGGYFTILTPPEGTSATKRVAYRSRFVHSAVGYPGAKFLPDLQEYRQRYE